MQKKTLRTGFLVTALLAMLFLAFRMVQPYIVTLALAATVAVLAQPLHRKLLRVTRGRRGLASLCTLLFVGVLILLPLTFILAQVVSETFSLYSTIGAGKAEFIPGLITRANTFLSHALPMQVDLGQYLNSALAWLAGNLGSVFSNALTTFIHLFLGAIALFYLLKDGPAFVSRIIDLSPLRDAEDRRILTRLEQAVNSVIRGSLFIAALQGFSSGIGLALFQVPNPVLWGSMAAIAALIPTLGTSMVIIPAVLFLYFTGHIAGAVGLALWGTLCVGLIDNLIGPRLVGRGVHIHPLLILFAILGGVHLFGPAGIILGPLTASLLVALLELYGEIFEAPTA